MKASSLLPEMPPPSDMYKKAQEYIEQKGGSSIKAEDRKDEQKAKEEEDKRNEDAPVQRRLFITREQ
jgi:hypothetical protein